MVPGMLSVLCVWVFQGLRILWCYIESEEGTGPEKGDRKI